MTCQFRLTTQNDPPRLRTLAPLAGPAPDQFALELGETAQNSQHQATMRRRRVSPNISKGLKAGSLLSNRAQQVEEIAG